MNHLEAIFLVQENISAYGLFLQVVFSIDSFLFPFMPFLHSRLYFRCLKKTLPNSQNDISFYLVTFKAI